MIYYIATFLFFVCTILTLTSVREEPLRSQVSSRNNGDIESSSDDDDEQVEIEMDEGRPLLSSRRNNSQSFNSSNIPIRSRSNKYFSGLNKQEGFVEIDAATGVRIPYDHVGERTDEGILLKTFQNACQIEPEQIPTSNSFNRSTIGTQEFSTELQQKAKLVKLGSYSIIYK